MAEQVSAALGQQIVDTIKDVCRHDINFISPSGIILASTDARRIGSWHAVGRQAAELGRMLEVGEDDAERGMRCGVNLPVFYEEQLFAVIGITGIPDEVRQFAYLAERITGLLMREQALNRLSRRETDKKQFVIQALIRGNRDNEAYLTSCLEAFGINFHTKKRIILLRLNARCELTNQALLETRVHQLLEECGVPLYAFLYPRDYIGVLEESMFQKTEETLRRFAQKNSDVLYIAVGRAAGLFRLDTSYASALTALKSISEKDEGYALFDALTLELVLSSLDADGRAAFLEKTIKKLSEADCKLLCVYYEADQSLAESCKRLFIHKNTLQYRLKRIHETCGLDPRSFQDAVLLYLALRLNGYDTRASL